MGSEFTMLSVGVSGLQAERKALEVTGQNIANADTDGYTRQRVVMQAVGGSVVPAMYSKSDGIGSGVTISGVDRLQDAFLEQRANGENGTLSTLQSNQQTLSDIENSFGEPGDLGLQHLMSTYWTSWADVGNNTPDTSARTELIGSAQSLAGGLNEAATSLNQQWASSRQSLTTIVAQVNVTSSNIAALNKAIVAATAAGNQPNDLMDQRDLMIRQLASVLGVTTKPNANGATDVLLGGSPLVSGNLSRQLQVGGATALDQATATPVTVSWADTGTPAQVSAGQVGGLLGALNTTLPSYTSQLDAVAKSLVTSVNALQTTGYDLNGDPGTAFFDPTKTTAATITVAISDPKQVAASKIAPSGAPPSPSLDGSNAQALADMAGSTTGPDAAYRQMIVQLGSQSQAAQQKTTTQQSVVEQVQTARDSAAGVDLDEEQTNLITYQQAYNAAAEYISVLNSVMDTLINKMLV